MSIICKCGGIYIRTDIVGKYDPKYKRVMYSDTDPLKSTWECNGCGDIRTQRKRQPRRGSITFLETPKRVRVLTFFYGRHDNPGEYRWWRNDCPGDMFDIISLEELNKRIEGAAMCKIKTVNHLQDFVNWEMIALTILVIIKACANRKDNNV